MSTLERYYPSIGMSGTELNSTMSGASSAISAGGQAINSCLSMAMQDSMAKMMLAHQERMATGDYNFKLEQLGDANKLMDSVAGIQKSKNAVMLENAGAHKGYDIARARLVEQKKTAKSTQIANKAAISRALSGRNSAFYGKPFSL